MNSKMNTVIIAALFLVFTSSMMQMNGVEAAKNNSNNRKLRGADNNKVHGKIPNRRNNNRRELVGAGANGCHLKIDDVEIGGSCGDQLAGTNLAKGCFYDAQGDLVMEKIFNDSSITYKNNKMKTEGSPRPEGSTKCVCEKSDEKYIWTDCAE